MSTPDDLERQLQSMAEFDRQEDAVGECPEEWWVVSHGELEAERAHALTHDTHSCSARDRLEQLTSPMDEGVADEIVAAALAACRPAANDPAPGRGPARPRRWWTPTVILAGISIAAAVGAVWLLRSPDELGDAMPIHVVPHRLELGGTAHILGADGPGPRRYGPGDELLLRALPMASGSPPRHIELQAVPARGGMRRAIESAVSVDPSGTIELRVRIADQLETGPWSLRLELGDPRVCMPGKSGCIELTAPIEIVSE